MRGRRSMVAFSTAVYDLHSSSHATSTKWLSFVESDAIQAMPNTACAISLSASPPSRPFRRKACDFILAGWT